MQNIHPFLIYFEISVGTVLYDISSLHSSIIILNDIQFQYLHNENPFFIMLIQGNMELAVDLKFVH